ncbi:hypothetical protein H6F98_31245 [Microcoleus sp. FACHB-SPT15]|uniref:hypothetical protein n=1 Tax=Microcoleus sp. FACHB-SPT15 TaxID=2692830 RepID=UPI0017868366|nr:hypothetical protein [Microcoleus sp. FACHB-SPT15]MBD1809891.1 hypothetical protein [Microcoleus sp. FACHB-SPT15]
MISIKGWERSANLCEDFAIAKSFQGRVSTFVTSLKSDRTRFTLAKIQLSPSLTQTRPSYGTLRE